MVHLLFVREVEVFLECGFYISSPSLSVFEIFSLFLRLFSQVEGFTFEDLVVIYSDFQLTGFNEFLIGIFWMDGREFDGGEFDGREFDGKGFKRVDMCLGLFYSFASCLILYPQKLHWKLTIGTYFVAENTTWGAYSFWMQPGCL